MDNREQAQAGANVPSQDLNGPAISSGLDVSEKYSQERDKRLRADGTRQFIDLYKSPKYQHFLVDPWIPAGAPLTSPAIQNGHTRALIAGAGFGGILFAVKLIQAGFAASDITFVDVAGGFGGTWYWNRYPGLMCDVESYIYLPLLEEMGYMPKTKYAGGEEIRLYIESVCKKFRLNNRALFQSAIKDIRWDDQANEWIVDITRHPKGGSEESITLRADYTVLTSGVLNNPKLPDIPGLDNFTGHCFHTSRWDYAYTGGSISDPSLNGLQGKRIGILGTGATAIQAVPHLAKYGSHLYVFQRTPSSVDSRDNRDTTGDEWEKIAAGKGWWRERNRNFNSFVGNAPEKPAVNLVNDRWTTMPSYSALIGSVGKTVTMETMPDHIKSLHELDFARSERVRQRAEDIVKDKATADKLKAWYPGWCKRPCFHDEYLQTFNQPNVELVDTDGRGIDSLTPNSVVVDGKEYPVDVLIFSTGFRSPGIGSAADKAGITVLGRNGLPLSQRYGEGLDTLHGVVSKDFPNMFWPGPSQAAATSNQVFALDQLATHVAYMITEAEKKRHAAGEEKKVVIEPTLEAIQQWSMQVMMQATSLAAMAGCTPGYLNMEGEVDKTPPEQQMKAAKAGIWARGIEDYIQVIEKWRSSGDMAGLEVSVIG